MFVFATNRSLAFFATSAREAMLVRIARLFVQDHRIFAAVLVNVYLMELSQLNAIARVISVANRVRCVSSFSIYIAIYIF